MPLLLLPPDGAKQGRSSGRRRPWARGPGAWWWPGLGGKGQGVAGIRFPSSISEEGARGEEHGGHGRGGSAAAVGGAVEVARGGCRQGKREVKGPNTYLDPWFG